jgi:predicted CXXCH cytochrome family protein
MNKLLFIAICVAIVTLPATSQAQSCVTAECHVSYGNDIDTHPAEKDCIACHVGVPDNHVDEGFTPPPEPTNCALCHEGIIKENFPHKPVTATSCELCHNPHGNKEILLLPESYSTKFFIDYSDKAHILCFSCHDRGLLLFAETSFSTGFRDGIKNLHFKHVNKSSRGRSCKLCHEVHGSGQPELIARTVSFGTWQMPMNFIKTENGGSCAPGCHEPRQYGRK